MSNDYDATCRRMVHAQPDGFLPFLIPGFEQTARHVGWVDTRRIPFPGHPDQTGDLVFELTETGQANPPWAVPLEFQIEPDPRMFGWLFTFLGTIVNERRPNEERGSEYQLGAVVVNLTGTSQSIPASRRHRWPGRGKRDTCVLTVWEWYLAELSAKSTLAAIARKRYHPAILPWISLMAGGSEPASIRRALHLAQTVNDSAWQAEFAYHTRILAEKSDNPMAWREALEGWEMIRSETMEATRREGGLVMRREDVVRVLRARTQGEVSSTIATAIRGCTDMATLDRWLDAAAVSDSLEQFRQLAGL